MKVLQVFNESFSAIEFAGPLIRTYRELGITPVLACSGRSYRDAPSYVDELRSAGVEVREVDIPRVPTPLASGRTLATLVRLIKRERFDLVHTHQSSAGILGRSAAAAARTPMVHTVYDYAFPDYRGARRRVFLALERWAARRTDRILFISRSELEWAERFSIGPAARRVDLGWGVDLDRFQPGAITPGRLREVGSRYSVPADRVVIGGLGRLVRRKGWDDLLGAFAEVCRTAEGVHLLVAGGGPEEDNLRDLAQRLGVSERVTFTGFIRDRADIPVLYRLLDVFCLPTRREGYGMAFAEAAAMGVPVVAPSISPVDELVRDGETGRLVPPGRIDGYVEALTALVRDRELREAMGRKGRELAASRFDLKSRAQVIARTYDEVLNRR